MASRSTTRENTQEADGSSGQAAMADMTRQQMATTASTASAVLRALDTYQQAQQHMIQRAAVLQEQTAERLRGASSPVELMAIHSTLMMSGWTEMAQYAQELMLASLKAQNEFMRSSEVQQGTATHGPTAAASPLFQAWQAVFAAPLNGTMAAANAARPH